MGATLIRVVLIVSCFVILLSLWGFYSSIRPPRLVSALTPHNLKLAYEKVSFTTTDGVDLRGWFIPAARRGAKTVILLHGYPADKGNILPPMAFLHDDFNLFLFDFRYLGESGGSYSTAGAKEVEDLLAAIRFLKSRGIEEVGVWGFSMGGAVALMAISQAPGIRAVVAESSYASLAQMALELFPLPLLKHPIAYLVGLWAKLFLGIDLGKVSPVESVRTAKVPVLLIHSLADAVIPFSHARQLQEAMAHHAGAEFWFNEGFAHGQLHADYESRVAGFFAKHL
jgi:dipeptidyl aminopeptidase/acylaminoacyl peptidase